MPDQALTGAWVSKDIIAFEQSVSIQDELCGATIQLMDSVVFILDMSSLGVLEKDHLDMAFDDLAHILKHRSMQKKPVQILLNKTDIFLRNINEVLLPSPSEHAKHPSHRASIDGVIRYLAEYMGGLDRFQVRYINALSAGWMQKMLEDWRLMGIYKNLAQCGLV
ncbi:hypothetical protein PHISP_04781 [Aspergillus sp. HF37]|nr:hypothetical protein PHISP_04781 [Aspergillus sp. HF37]